MNLCDDSGCLHSPEILIYWVWNNNILFYSVNCYPRDMFAWKLLNESNEKPPFCVCAVFHFMYALMFVSRCTKQKLTNLRERPGSLPAWHSRNSNLGRETHCDLMIQPEVKAEKERRERQSALTFKSTPQSNWIPASVSWTVLVNIAQSPRAVKQQREELGCDIG